MPFAEFESDAANGNLPDFSMIEPSLAVDTPTTTLPAGERMGASSGPRFDPPSSILGGEAFLARSTTHTGACRSRRDPTSGNTTLFIGWDEPGGTYDHVPPPAVPPPDPAAPPGKYGFTFDRSGYRVPAIIVSPWVAEGAVFNEEYRHTSLIATFGNCGSWASRSASAMPRRELSITCSRATRHVIPRAGPTMRPRPVPDWQLTKAELGEALSPLGRAVGPAVLEYAEQSRIPIPEGLDSEPGEQLLDAVFAIAARYFPRLAEAAQPDDVWR